MIKKNEHRSLMLFLCVKPLTANPTKWSNTLKQLVGKLPTNCLSVFDHFVELELKGLNINFQQKQNSSPVLFIVDFSLLGYLV